MNRIYTIYPSNPQIRCHIYLRSFGFAGLIKHPDTGNLEASFCKGRNFPLQKEGGKWLLTGGEGAINERLI